MFTVYPGRFASLQAVPWHLLVILTIRSVPRFEAQRTAPGRLACTDSLVETSRKVEIILHNLKLSVIVPFSHMCPAGFCITVLANSGGYSKDVSRFMQES